jgi:DegV family protein with EDD domain
MVTIITDSCSDLSPDLIASYQIKVIPLLVVIEEETYQDGVTITPDQLFAMVKAKGKLPKTAAPSVQVFTDAFNEAHDEVLCICLSSALSATFQTAVLAAQNCVERKVRVIDSLNLSTGIGLQVLRSAELRDQGLSRDDIADIIIKETPNLRTSFVIDTMDYLYKGGRCTALQSLVGSLLKIRPVIEVKDGKLGVKDKLRGTRKKALDAMLSDLAKHQEELDRHRIFVTHSGCEDDAIYLAEEIKKTYTPDEVHITRAGAVISSHCGPDTIGILYKVNPV